MSTARSTHSTLDEKLHWMLDAPFFIDEAQLSAFYDAVVQPQVSREESIRIEITEETARNLGTNLDIDINPLALAGSLANVLGPFNVKASGGFGFSRDVGETETQTIDLKPIRTPQRQLIQLTTQYLVHHPDRIFFVDDVQQDRNWFDSDEIERVPREVVFFDLPSEEKAREKNVPGTKLIPMAVEFADGRIETLYDRLGAKRRGDSWAPYIENFSPEEAVEVLEEATEGKGRIEWINFRVPLDGDITARVHFEPRTTYNNGTFAYNLIHLGYKHGLRLVGTVHQEPDVRVLAGYRK
jgi:hypothetical protein